MAATALTITLTEAQATRVINGLCKSAGLVPSGANAKTVIIGIIKERVAAQLEAEARQEAIEKVLPVEGIS